MNGLVYLFVAFVLVWGVTFAYLFSLIGKQKRLQADLDAIRTAIKQCDEVPAGRM